MSMEEIIVAVRGGGDIGTAVAHRLYRSGFKVIIIEAKKPTVIRRTVSFAEAVNSGRAVVEEVECVRVENIEYCHNLWKENKIPLLVDEEAVSLEQFKIDILVDAILAKRNTGSNKCKVPYIIALGPGFTAPLDADVVIETKRGHNLGRLIYRGRAEENTGIPGEVCGFSEERIIRAPMEGTLTPCKNIGDMVQKGDIVAYCNNLPITANLPGVLRGIITKEFYVHKGMKIGDIDPRGEVHYCYTISDKGRAIGGAVLEAILYYLNVRGEK